VFDSLINKTKKFAALGFKQLMGKLEPENSAINIITQLGVNKRIY